jgi:hypothetical protein
MDKNKDPGLGGVADKKDNEDNSSSEQQDPNKVEDIFDDTDEKKYKGGPENHPGKGL